MLYSEFAEVYEELYATSKRLEKETILAEFLRVLKENGETEWIYLLRGKVFADYDDREFGISQQLAIKAIAFSFGISEEKIVERYKKIGDLGEIAQEFAEKKKQVSLFSSKLTVKKVFTNLRKVVEVEGKGAVQGKMNLVAELLGSASGKEAKYVIRTLLGDLRVGVADATLSAGIAECFFADEKTEMSEKIAEVFAKLNDSAEVFAKAAKGKKELEKVEIVIGRAINVMLPIKVTNIEEAFRICGRPAAIEHKYDGFRVVVTCKNGDVKLFTRRLENVTKQFPDVVNIVKKNINAKEFILDSEVVGYDPKTKLPRPFEAISQRIKRKYDIDKLEKELPVEINVFDAIFVDGKNLMSSPFKERRKVIEKIVKNEDLKIRVSKMIITSSEEEAMKFYEQALAFGEEGIMVKNLDATYNQGRNVGFIVKMKPILNDLDLVIVGAEHGSGKRAGWLTSYTVACQDNGSFLEIGKVSSGLKELQQEGGTTYDEMTKILTPLIISNDGNEVRVKPKVVVAVTYQNIQPSPSYTSGYALRFPRITAYRPDKALKEIATLKDIEKEVKKMERK